MENCFSSSIVSHCINPGSKIKSYSDSDDFWSIGEIIFSVKNAEIVIGALITLILWFVIGLIISSII